MIYPEETIDVSPKLEHQAAFPGVRAYLCPCCFLPFLRNVSYPYWPPVECSLTGHLFQKQSNFPNEAVVPFGLSEYFLGSLRIELLHYLLTLCITGGLLA